MDTEIPSISDPYLDKLDRSLTVSIESHKISSQEFDKQVVYIAGGALALTIGFLKDILAIAPKEYLFFLFWAWISFGFALFFNLFSHKKGTEAYNESINLITYYRDCHEKVAVFESEKAKSCSDKMNYASKWISALNWLCLITVALGITFFITFAYKTFNNMADKREHTQTSTKPAPKPEEVRALPPTIISSPEPPPQQAPLPRQDK